jgi:manganese transport protein
LAIIGLAFIYELFLVHISWPEAMVAWVKPSFPGGSMVMIMSVLGAVVMPHNLFLHSEIIQSRQWNLEEEKVIQRQLRFEFLDTLSSMIVGWAINSAMILLAAALFFQRGLPVQELQQAKSLLEPLLGVHAAIIFAVALLFSGLASTITSGIAAGTIMAGIYDEPYNIKDPHSKLGVFISFILALLLIFMIKDPFKGLIFSQMILSMQLPITVFMQIRLTSSSKVMGPYANKPMTKYLLYAIGAVVAVLNLALVISFFAN